VEHPVPQRHVLSIAWRSLQYLKYYLALGLVRSPGNGEPKPLGECAQAKARGKTTGLEVTGTQFPLCPSPFPFFGSGPGGKSKRQ